MSRPPTSWLPDFVFTGSALERGLAVVADAAGRLVRLSREPADLAAAARLPGRVLLPGLVNAHSHAFMRVIRGRTEYRTGAQRDTFWTWREKMFHAATTFSPADLRVAARMAFLEMALGGATTVGEFHYLHHQPDGRPYENPNEMALALAEAAREVGVRLCVLHSAYGRAGWKRAPSAAQVRFITESPDAFLAAFARLRTYLAAVAPADALWAGLAPHSIRAVPLEYLRRLQAAQAADDLPLHMHVSEQPAENDACLAEHGTTPLGLLEHEGLLHPRFTAVHAIHISLHEAAALARSGARVCACPTTERNLGDGVVPADVLTGRGVPLALGSDSNIQIDLLEDARQLEYHLRVKHLERQVLAPVPAPDAPPDAQISSLAIRLLQCATSSGAVSLGGPGGELTPGRTADFFTVALDDPALAGADEASILPHVVFAGSRAAVREVVVGGREVIADGRHARQAEIVADFAALQRRLWGPRA